MLSFFLYVYNKKKFKLQFGAGKMKFSRLRNYHIGIEGKSIPGLCECFRLSTSPNNNDVPDSIIIDYVYTKLNHGSIRNY